MNTLRKERIKAAFKYTWPFYIISALIIGFGLNFIFSITHKTPAYKTLTVFVSGIVKDLKAFKKDTLAKYEDKELKSVTYIEADPSEGTYYTKLSVAGYSSADVLIIPVSKLENFNLSAFALELEDSLINEYCPGYTFYKQEEVNYGIKLDKSKVEEYVYLPSEDCYMFLNATSVNLGEYSKKQIKEHDVALCVAKDWGM